LRPECSLENEIINDLVQIRLQARRIDKHFVHDVQNAQVPNVFEDLARIDERYRANLFGPAAPPTAANGQAVRGSLHPVHCVWSLQVLKLTIEQRGVQPEGDLAVLAAIYGGDLTMAATGIVLQYKLLAIALSEGEAAEAAKKRSSYQARILQEIDREIDSQSHRLALETHRDQFEMLTNRAPFLTDSELSKFDRYRCGNTGQFMRLIAAYERIRRLRNPENGPDD
jgi:hypothetical protein